MSHGTLKLAKPDRTLPDPAVEPTIKVPRVAAILDISERHAYAAIERGEIPSIRVGKRIVIPTAKFLNQCQLVPAGTAVAA